MSFLSEDLDVNTNIAFYTRFIQLECIVKSFSLFFIIAIFLSLSYEGVPVCSNMCARNDIPGESEVLENCSLFYTSTTRLVENESRKKT